MPGQSLGRNEQPPPLLTGRAPFQLRVPAIHNVVIVLLPTDGMEWNGRNQRRLLKRSISTSQGSHESISSSMHHLGEVCQESLFVLFNFT